jgi:hypothetical protein
MQPTTAPSGECRSSEPCRLVLHGAQSAGKGRSERVSVPCDEYSPLIGYNLIAVLASSSNDRRSVDSRRTISYSDIAHPNERLNVVTALDLATG